MSQSKTGSLVEALGNVAIGFGINYLGNIFILPMFGYNVTLGDAFWIGVVFTFISIARSYIIRRWFNGLKFKWNKETED
jgi:hypothetical protein